MKKQYLLVLLLIPIFFIDTTIIISENTPINKTTNITHSIIEDNTLGDPLGDKQAYIQNITDTHNIAIDGNLSDWEGIPKGKINNIEVGLAFNTSHIFISCQWYDNVLNNNTPYLILDYMINDTHGDWYLNHDIDDILLIGFEQDNKTDIGIWSASFRTEDDLMFECDENGLPDNGTLPYIKNYEEDSYRPIWDNDQNPMPPDDSTIPLYTRITAWFDSNQRPNESQNDMQISINYGITKSNYYTAEIIRRLNTTHADDFVFNFSKPLNFLIGRDSYEFDLLINFYTYALSYDNEPAELSFDAILDSNLMEDGIQVSSNFIISGKMYDDYQNYEIKVENPKSIYTVGYATINKLTGEWYYLFSYSKNFLPLGETTIIVTLYPNYEDPLTLNQTIFVEDTLPPIIQGVVDIGERYPEGVPADEQIIEISIGIIDNYDTTSDITAYLYYYKENEVVTPIQMSPFTITSRVFSATIPISHGLEENYEYTYFVQVYDNSWNTVSSDYYSFISQKRIHDNGGVSKTILIPYLPFEAVLITLIFFYGVKKLKKNKQGN
ncbi:MAG: hypothetical protein ACFFDW_09770 [Candidatus Thorarchaeota archaeon]